MTKIGKRNLKKKNQKKSSIIEVFEKRESNLSLFYLREVLYGSLCIYGASYSF